MRLILINGANMNMLGKRPSIYGKNKEEQPNFKDLVKKLKKYAKSKKISLLSFQSNSEEKIIKFLHKMYNKGDGFIVNLGAFTHYSYAIRDAIEMITKKIVEVHITDISFREDFRKISVIESLASKRFIGHGIKGYFEAIDYFIED